jgi:GNAT superfamily N-acetyltransferase
MGGETVDSERAGSASYKVIRFSGPLLPARYQNMVFSKWLRSLRFGNDYFKLIESAAYYSSYHRYLEAILASTDSTVALAVLVDDVDVVLGFAVYRGPVLDYVHVQRDYRRNGIARALVSHPLLAITHITKPGMAIWAAKLKDVVFNPFL